MKFTVEKEDESGISFLGTEMRIENHCMITN